MLCKLSKEKLLTFSIAIVNFLFPREASKLSASGISVMENKLLPTKMYVRKICLSLGATVFIILNFRNVSRLQLEISVLRVVSLMQPSSTKSTL